MDSPEMLAILDIRHGMKTNKTHKIHNIENETDEQHGLHQNPGVREPRGTRMLSSSSFL